jgi:hypothetical protein
MKTSDTPLSDALFERYQNDGIDPKSTLYSHKDLEQRVADLRRKLDFLENAFRSTDGYIEVADDEQDILGFYTKGHDGLKAVYGRDLEGLIENMMAEPTE